MANDDIFNLGDIVLANADIDNIIISSLSEAIPNTKRIEELITIIIDENTLNQANLDRIRLWIWPSSKIEERDCKHYYNATIRKRSNLPLCTVTISKDAFRTKTAFLIGRKLNILRASGVPNFRNTYASISAATPIIIDNEVETWFTINKYGLGDSYYLLTEHIKTYNLAEVLSSLSSYQSLISIFLQSFLALKFANDNTGFIHNNINCKTLSIRKDVLSPTIRYDKFIIETQGLVVIFSDFDNSYLTHEKTDVKRPIIYDFYDMCVTLLLLVKNKPIMENGIRSFIENLITILSESGIPYWYITNLTLRSVHDATPIRFPSRIEDITYEMLQTIVFKIIDKSTYCEIREEEGVVVKDMELKSSPVRCYVDDSLLTICYDDTFLSKDDNEKNLVSVYLKAHEAVILDIKSEIDECYADIEEDSEILLRINYKKIIFLSKVELGRLCDVITNFFANLLRQRVRIDELATRLYTSLGIDTEISNENLENYIKEHESRLSRIMGENIDIYKSVDKILPSTDWDTIQLIWIILNNKLIKTK